MARTKNYTLGAGKLYFDRFDDDGNTTGEYYIGNTTSLTGSTDETREEHYSSDEKERAKDASVVTQSDQTVGFTTDDIQPENLALLWKGTAEQLAVSAQSDVVETITVKRGRWYQLGMSPTSPTGARSVSITSVTDDESTPVAIPAATGPGGINANYEVDTELGRHGSQQRREHDQNRVAFQEHAEDQQQGIGDQQKRHRAADARGEHQRDLLWNLLPGQHAREARGDRVDARQMERQERAAAVQAAQNLPRCPASRVTPKSRYRRFCPSANHATPQRRSRVPPPPGGGYQRAVS